MEHSARVSASQDGRPEPMLAATAGVRGAAA